MTADIDPSDSDSRVSEYFADRCAVAATSLRKLAELGARPDTDFEAEARATGLTASLLTDPEALLAVALVIEQARAGAADRERAAFAEVCTETFGGDGDPICCEVRGPHDTHCGRVSWGGL